MPFPVSAERVLLAESELGRSMPQELRERLMRENGGEVTAVPIREDEQADFDPYWELHPVWDDSDRKRAGRSANHIVSESKEARAWPHFPEGAVPVASNGTGDRLILLPASDEIVFWTHEGGATVKVHVYWD